jgi:acetyl-CoA C-acetyltransferase
MTSETNREVWIIDGRRTAIGSFGRTLKKIPVEKLCSYAIKGAVREAKVPFEKIDGVYFGNGYQSAYAPNPARIAAQQAGIPDSVPAMTVQRQCGSGMEAVHVAVKDIKLNLGDIYVAGGGESMSTVPYLVPGIYRFTGPLSKSFRFGPRPMFDVGAFADDGLVPATVYGDMKTTHMSGTAQRLADTYGITRQQADEYALESQRRANKAIEDNRFAREIEPIDVPGKGLFLKDEHPRKTTIEKLAKLPGVNPKPPRTFSAKLADNLKKFIYKTATKRNFPNISATPTITAGNSSGINDGACALVLASSDKAKALGLEPLAKIIDTAVVGVDAEQMGLGPVPAIKKLLEKNGLTIEDIDLFEINEAFAAQYLACEKLLGLDREKVNVNGGAIALGHPIAMSGARIILTLAHELKARKKKLGIAALCIGGGQGIATLIESPN